MSNRKETSTMARHVTTFLAAGALLVCLSLAFGAGPTVVTAQHGAMSPRDSTPADLTATAIAAATGTELAQELSTAQALAVQFTATAAAQRSATAGPQQTATALAGQTATAVVQQTAAVVAQQTAVAATVAVAAQQTLTAVARSQAPSAPAPTSMPQPTSTPTKPPLPVATYIYTAAPIGSAVPTAAAQPKPGLAVTLNPSLVRPGAAARVTIGYLPRAMVDVTVTIAGAKAIRLMDGTDEFGRLTFALTVPSGLKLVNGRTTARIAVEAMSGSWRSLGSLTPVLHPGAVEHLSIRAAPNAYVHAVVTFPDRRTASLYSKVDAKGLGMLAINVPALAQKISPSATSRIAVEALTGIQHESAVRALDITDMLIAAAPGAFKDCTQTQVVRVSYRPNTPLRVLLLLPRNTRIPFTVSTNNKGEATLPVTLRYTKSASPVRIDIQADDARAGVKRGERITVNVVLPKACSAT